MMVGILVVYNQSDVACLKYLVCVKFALNVCLLLTREENAKIWVFPVTIS
jgi:hypothetical protein